MRPLIYFVAVTLDGKIAGPEGQFDFFPFDAGYGAQLNEEWADGMPTALLQALGVTPTRSKWDAVVMGRATYEVGLAEGVDNPYAHLDTYVYSGSLPPGDGPVTIVRDDPVEHVRSLKQTDGVGIWLCGGGRLAATLVGEIDQLVLKINPVTAGKGIELFRGGFRPEAWRLRGTRVFDLGVILAHYDRST